MEFRILGNVEVTNGPGVIAVGGAKPRAVLAVLLLHANQPVSAEHLAVALWGDEAPHTAIKNVQVHVSRLRKQLPNPDLLVTTPAGYCLRVRPGQLDAERFEQLVEDGLRELGEEEPERAGRLLREALALWRGQPLADVASEPFAAAQITRLEEQRLAALEARVDADLAAGRHSALVGELQQLLAEHPQREGLAARLMLALYRCGRQREALEVFGELRKAKVDASGLEPGRELRRLQDEILCQDPSLDLPEPQALPAELDPPSDRPLVGRDIELAWLKERWDTVRGGGRGRIVSLVGSSGSGKTRLAAELARTVNRRGVPVIYGAQDTAAEAIAQALTATSPTLLVLDDVTPPDVGVFAAIPVLTLVTGERPGPGRDVLRLAPLDLGAVREIARAYPGEVDDEELLRASGGLPGEVHRLAQSWAHAAAARRVEHSANRAETSRTELQLLESELAGNVAELQAAAPRTDDELDGPVVCPFKGLASFEEADAPYFFGRERLIADVIARMVGAPLLGVVGDSGSGKSSLVKAGLLPALAAGTLPRSETWAQVVIRPGEQPLRALEGALDGLGDRRFVLVVDQFEETFTVCHDKAQREAFLGSLVDLAERRTGQIVLTVRADHYSRCAENARLARLLDRHQVLVGPMDGDELRSAVEGPARRAGLHVESKLTNALVADVEAQPGPLPLLSTALLELWQHRSGRRLTYVAYERTGGVSGAVARLAEGAFRELDPEAQRVAHDVMMRLVVDTGSEVERRPVVRSEFAGEDVAPVIEALTEARLLTAHEGTVEVAHEALLREWPRLRQWIDENREPMRVERKLIDAAGDWEAGGRDEEMLWGRVRLSPAEELARRGLLTPGERERAFMAASRERLTRVRRVRRRWVTVAFAALGVALVAITAIAVVAIDQRGDANHQKALAQSRQLALESGNLLASDPELGLRLAMTAYDVAPTDEANFALRQAVLSYHQLASFPADTTDANAAAFSPDGTRVLSGGHDGTARIWDVAKHRALGTYHHGAELKAARYSPRGDRIALGYDDGTVIVTDGSLGAPRELLPKNPDVGVTDVAFSGDGSTLAAGLTDGTVRVFRGGAAPITLGGDTDAVEGVALDASGQHLVSGGDDGTVRLWDATAGAVPRTIFKGSAAQNAVAFSPSGERIAAVGDDDRVRLFDGDGAPVRTFDGLGKKLYSVAFSSDSRRLATGGRDGVIRIWSVAGGPAVRELRSQSGRIADLGFGPRPDRVVSAGDDGSARVWDAGTALAWNIGADAGSLQITRDGKTVATVSSDGTARLYNAGDGALERTFAGPATHYINNDISPNGDQMVVGYDDESIVKVWPLVPGAKGETIKFKPGSGFGAVRFSADGKRIVYADYTGHIYVRTLATGEQIELGGVPKDFLVNDLSFGSGGKRVAVVGEKSAVLVWRLDHPQKPERALTSYRGQANSLAYANDGRIVTAGADRTVRIWPATGDKAMVLRGHTDEVDTVQINSAGDRILSSSADGQLRLWDARRGTALAVLMQAPGQLYMVAMTPGGRIATLDELGNVEVFPCDACGTLASVQAAARALHPRALSPAERTQFLASAS